MKESSFQTLEQIKDNWPEYWDKIVPEVLMFFHIDELLDKSVQEVSKSYDIQRGDFEVLFRLRSSSKQGVQTPTEIYTKLGLSSGGLTKILHRLADKELIERLENQTDKRSSLVRLTKQGEVLLCKIMDGIIEQDQKFFANLSLEERNLLQMLFKKLLTGTEK